MKLFGKKKENKDPCAGLDFMDQQRCLQKIKDEEDNNNGNNNNDNENDNNNKNNDNMTP